MSPFHGYKPPIGGFRHSLPPIPRQPLIPVGPAPGPTSGPRQSGWVRHLDHKVRWVFSVFFPFWRIPSQLLVTLPEANFFAPENGWLEDGFPFGR